MKLEPLSDEELAELGYEEHGLTLDDAHSIDDFVREGFEREMNDDRGIYKFGVWFSIFANFGLFIMILTEPIWR